MASTYSKEAGLQDVEFDFGDFTEIELGNFEDIDLGNIDWDLEW